MKNGVLVNESKNKIWFFERYFRRSPIIYSIIALFLGVIVIFIYWISSFFVIYSPWDIFTIIPAVANGFYLTIQLIGIPYFLIRVKKTFFTSLYNEKNAIEFSLYEKFNSLLGNKKLIYAILLLIFVPFFFLTFLFIKNGLTFFEHQKTFSALFLDIFNIGLTYLSLYFLGVLLWMVLITFWIYYKMDKEPYWRYIEVDLLSSDGIAGLKPLHSLLRFFLSFYFIVLIFFILSFISPSTMIQREGIFIIFLLVIGLSLSFLGFISLNNLIRRISQELIEKYNKKIKELSQKLLDFSSNDVNTYQLKELAEMRTLLELYHAERDRMVSIVNRNRVINKWVLIAPGIPCSLSIITFLLDFFHYHI